MPAAVLGQPLRGAARLQTFDGEPDRAEWRFSMPMDLPSAPGASDPGVLLADAPTRVPAPERRSARSWSASSSCCCALTFVLRLPAFFVAGLQLRRDVPRHPGPGDQRGRRALRGRHRPQAAARAVRLRGHVRVLRHHRAVVGAGGGDARGRAHRAAARDRGSPPLRRARWMDRRRSCSCSRWSRSRRKTARPRTSRCSCCRR